MKADFARILAEANGEDYKDEEKPLIKREPLRESDALSLSIQGKKAIKPQDRFRKVIAIEAQTSKNADFQGNRICLSMTGQWLAADIRNNAVWETRKERK